MTTSLQAGHPRWPSYFDPDILVYVEDWDVLAEEQVLLLGIDHHHLPQRVKLLSITHLPDQLLFLNGFYLPDTSEPLSKVVGDLVHGDTLHETYYGICGLTQFVERAPTIFRTLLTPAPTPAGYARGW